MLNNWIRYRLSRRLFKWLRKEWSTIMSVYLFWCLESLHRVSSQKPFIWFSLKSSSNNCRLPGKKLHIQFKMNKSSCCSSTKSAKMKTKSLRQRLKSSSSQVKDKNTQASDQTKDSWVSCYMTSSILQIYSRNQSLRLKDIGRSQKNGFSYFIDSNKLMMFFIKDYLS